MTTAQDRKVLLAILVCITVVLGCLGGYDWWQSTMPPLTNGQLAGAIERHAASGGFMEGSVAQVTCHTLAAPTPEGANRECHDSEMADICTVPSTPTVYELEIAVDGQDWREVSRTTESEGDCSVW